MKSCIAYGLAKGFDVSELRTHLQTNYRVTEYREVFHVQLHTNGDVFLFPFGSIVLWGVDADSEQRLWDELTPMMIDPLLKPEEDRFTFDIGAETIRIRDDHIQLTDGSPLEMLALSQGVAQSVKLAELEARASRTIDETAHIPRNLAETGSTRLTRRDIGRMRGKLILVESDINHHYALLDTPEFFWEYSELESLYLEMARYLDVQARVEVLNKKLGMIHKLFEMLADEQKHKHSSLLEWIIIWLIAVEILIFLGHDLLKWF
ncbi:RMD1 family protein [Porticoccaceae bacterium LTM1]|nr:RMD1 family protein [Porticoccaceae bacterium LTM1]